MKNNFGKYEIPPVLQKLIDLEKDLGDAEDFYLGLHFYLSLENFRYFNTPCDVVVFGNCGMDGIHYGFLTDFGSVTDLNVAPIVCVSPMDFDRPTRIVANNLNEFLKVNSTDNDLFYNQFDSEEAYLESKVQWLIEENETLYEITEDERLIKERVMNFLTNNIPMPEIDSPYRYIQQLERARQKTVSISTQDKIGVTTPLLQGEKHIHFPISKDTNPNLTSLQPYLDSAPIASRHVLFRDIQFNYLLDDAEELSKIVIDAMINMELVDEAKRLLEET